MPRVPRVSLVCPQCHKAFSLPPSLVRQGHTHCSWECRILATRIILECEHCHGSFTRPLSQKSLARFCSKECKDAHKKRVVDSVCPQCHKHFQRKPSKRSACCSQQCRWLLEKKCILHCCKQCGATFERHASDKNVQCCSTTCAALFKTLPGTPTEKAAALRHLRRARLKGAPVNDLSAAQWQEIQEAFDHRCAYCPPDCKACKKKTHKLTQDHISPLSKQGSNTVINVVPACLSCNSKKNNRAPLIPVQPLLLTIAPARPPSKRGKKAIS